MNRIAILVALCTAVMACNDNRDTATGPGGTARRATYILTGTVRDSAGVPVGGAVVQIVAGDSRGWSTSTNDSGFFKFIDVNGTVTVRISKIDYDTYQKTVDVGADTEVEVIVNKTLPPVLIEIGRTMRSHVSAKAAPCDPDGWDSMAPCRRFYFVPSAPGALLIEITWEGMPQLDATTVIPPNIYVATSADFGSNRVLMTADLIARVSYEIRVNSYYGAQSFDLKATFVPR